MTKRITRLHLLLLPPDNLNLYHSDHVGLEIRNIGRDEDISGGEPYFMVANTIAQSAHDRGRGERSPTAGIFDY
jgi:hypothetical protein